MRPTKSILAFCTAILFADLPHIGAAETNQTVSLTVDLTDGSRIIGTPSMEVVPLRTDYAKLDIPLRNIRSIAVDANHEIASLTMVNSDKLRGAVTMGPLQLKTIIGAVAVDFAFIVRMSVLAGDGRSLPSSLTDALVLYYSFDEDGHGAVKDDAGKTMPGEVLGAKWTDKGKLGGAYDFDGQKSRITTPSIDTSGEMTWSVWIQPRSFPTRNDAWSQFLGVRSRAWAWNSCNTALSFFCRDDLQPSRLALFFRVQDTPEREASVASVFQTRPDLDRWHHVAVVLDSSGMHLYLDAKLLAEKTDKTRIPAPCPMIIGCNDNGPQRFFDGLIDEVMIFKKAMTPDEVELLYNVQK